MVLGVVLSTVGFLAARLHIHVFDKAFLAKGRLDHTLKE